MYSTIEDPKITPGNPKIKICQAILITNLGTKLIKVNCILSMHKILDNCPDNNSFFKV